MGQGGGADSVSANVPDNNYVGMIGASSIANGGTMAGLMALVSGTNVAGIQGWGILLSDGGLCWGGASGTGGHTVQQVYDTHWPIMRDATPKRGFVGFYAGTNDTDALAPGGVPNAANIAARVEIVRDFITEARANGQVPFVCTIHPNNSGANGIAGIPAWRLALIDLCAEENCICVDTFSALGDPGTGLWLSNTYTEDGTSTALHIGPLGGPLAGQVIADALMPYRNPSHNPDFVSVGDDTTGWAWQGGLFTVDGNANGRPDGGGTGLHVDAWSAPTNTATMTKTAGAGDVVGNWLNIDKTGLLTTTSTSSTPTTAPGVMTFVEGDDFEVCYHMRNDLASAASGHALKLHSTASGSIFLFNHTTIRATYLIDDKVFWALHTQPAATTMRFAYSIEVTGANTDAQEAGIAMLSLKQV